MTIEHADRQAYDTALARHRAFQQLITDLSMQFISLPPARIEETLGSALEAIGRFAGVDRSRAFVFSPDRTRVQITHEWCAEGISSDLDAMQEISVEQYPWAAARILRGEVLRITSLADLPPEAAPEQRLAREQGIRSGLLVPMAVNQRVIGWVACNAVRAPTTWSDETVLLLRLAGNIFANALVRKWAEDERQGTHDRVFRHHAALLSIVKEQMDDLDAVLRRITEVSARTLGVQRVSVWTFSEQGRDIVCRDLFHLDRNSHEQGAVLAVRDHPRYFHILEDARALAASHARTDPRTSEYSEAYLSVHGIISMMDAPIRQYGTPLGVVCHEHTGPPRAWTPDEQSFAGSIADLVSLALQTAERVRAEQELQAACERLRELNQRVARAEEQERTRIARELHDEFGQALTGMKFDLAWLMKQVTAGTALPAAEAILGKLRSLTALTDQTIQAVRRIAASLRPSLIDDLGLASALEWQGQDFAGRTGIRCEVSVTPAAQQAPLHADTATDIFRVAQELLTNVARHAHAQTVQIRLSVEADGLRLEVHDDGRGITEQERAGTGTFGLLGIRERVSRLGGDFVIGGTPGGGTTARARIPLSGSGRS
ncbi:MAG: sensor histidine kinase [Nitrospiraceae bacterium]